MTAPPAVTATKSKAKQRPGDQWFSGTALFAGFMILATLAAVAIFLIIQSIPAVGATPAEANLLTTNFWDYVWPLLFGTIWAALLALLMAVPLSLAVALFITHYAPRRLAQSLGYIVGVNEIGLRCHGTPRGA
jgi:phosphate transport system permease protein